MSLIQWFPIHSEFAGTHYLRELPFGLFQIIIEGQRSFRPDAETGSAIDDIFVTQCGEQHNFFQLLNILYFRL